jgi:hypothetical protein
MQKSSLKLYFATFLFTLTLASFTFAGDAQCPFAPPPPPTDGNQGSGGRAAVIVNTNDVFNENIKYIKDFLSFLIKF